MRKRIIEIDITNVSKEEVEEIEQLLNEGCWSYNIKH